MIENNIDTLLDTIARISWILFAVYVFIVIFVALRRTGWISALQRLLSFQVFVPLLLVITIQLISMAIVFVLPQQVSVIISVLSANGIRPQPLRSGLHWIIPMLESDVAYPTYWQTYTMSRTPGEGNRPGDDSISARTSDGQEVTMDCSVIYRLDEDQAVSIHVDWQERYSEDFVRPLVRAVVRRLVSGYSAREVNSVRRQDLENALDRVLISEFSDKGLILDQFLLRDISFTEAYATAVENKQVALEGKEQTTYEADKMENIADGRARSIEREAQGQARAIEIEAEAQARAIEIEAEAQARALSLIGQSLAQNRDLLTYEYVQKLSPNIRVMLVPSTSPLILTLPDMEGTNEITGTASMSETVPMTDTVATP